MTTTTPINTHCPDCKRPLDYYLQQLHPKSTRTPNWYGTCNTPGCTLQGTTLSDTGTDHTSWDSADLDKYRRMVAAQRNGQHIAPEGGAA